MNKINSWDPVEMAQDTDFMTRHEMIMRLKKDLGLLPDDPFNVFDLPIPHNEAEYQENLRILNNVIGDTIKEFNRKRGLEGK